MSQKNAARQYEAMFLFPAGDVEPAVALARKIIESHGGEIIVAKKWDERKLAYEISKQKRGLYIITYFRAPTSTVAAIERDVRLSETVMRVLVLKADHLNEQEMNAVEPQPIIREERPERFDRFDRPADDRPPRRRREGGEGEGYDKE